MTEQQDLFEVASRDKVRFQFGGVWTPEDLWDMNIAEDDSRPNSPSLNGIHKMLTRQRAKGVGEESLLDEPSKEEETLSLKIDIVRHVAETMKKEQKARDDKAENVMLARPYEDALADKKNAALREMSEEELQKRIAELT